MADSPTYARVLITFWNDPKVRRLTLEQQHLLLYLFTSPHSNMIGLYYLPLLYASNEAKLPIETIEGFLRGPLAPFVTYDWETEEVLVHRFARHQIAETLQAKDKRVKPVIRMLRDAHSNALVARFAELYSDWPLGLNFSTSNTAEIPSKAPSHAPSEGPSKDHPKPLRSHSSYISSNRDRDITDAAAEHTGNSEEPGTSHASTHTREDEAAGNELAPDGSSGSSIEDFAIDQMAQVANAIARKIKPEHRERFNPAVQAIVTDEDSGAWLHPKTQQPVSWDQRAGLLALAGTILLAGERKDIRRALILAIQRKLDPFPQRSSEQQHEPQRTGKPSEPTPLAVLLPQTQQLDQFVSDSHRIKTWEQQHLTESRSLLAQAERDVDAELAADPDGKDAGPAWRRLAAQRKYRELVLQVINTANAA